MRVVRTLLLPAFAVALVLACSSKEETTSGTGNPFCDAAQAWMTKCGGATTAACDQSLLTDCTKYVSALSPALVATATTCLESANACTVTPSGCIGGAGVSQSASKAQLQVATDYCTKCQPSGASDCEGAFFSASGPASGIGAFVLAFGDTAAAAVDKCTSAANDCGTGGSSFTTCAETALDAQINVSQTTATCLMTAFTGPKPATLDAGSGQDAGMHDAGGVDSGPPNDDASAPPPLTGCTDTYEPNDTPETAHDFGKTDDSSAPLMVSATLGQGAAPPDVDWYQFLGNDAFNSVTAADPYAAVSATSNMQVCVWAKRTDGDSIAEGCSAGQQADYPEAGTPFVGCCSNESGVAQLSNYGRHGPDDSSNVMIRVQQLNTQPLCIDYQLTFSFTHS